MSEFERIISDSMMMFEAYNNIPHEEGLELDVDEYDPIMGEDDEWIDTDDKWLDDFQGEEDWGQHPPLGQYTNRHPHYGRGTAKMAGGARRLPKWQATANLMPNEKYFYGMTFALANGVPKQQKNIKNCVKFSLHKNFRILLETSSMVCIMSI